MKGLRSVAGVRWAPALLLAACGGSPPWVDPSVCDPRTLEPGEVRARQIPCSDELIDGGEGRSGDWLLENAYARYVVRGTYASLTHLGEEGGTLIDAATPGGTDVLLEYLPDGDRRTIEAVNDDGEASLVLPDVVYRLGADDGALTIEGTGAGSLQGRTGVTRTGATLPDGTSFFGLDGLADGDAGAVRTDAVTRAAVTPEALWPDGEPVDEAVDADAVIASFDGADLARIPVEDGRAVGWAPAGATFRGERAGCVYTGLTTTGCGFLQLRVADDAGVDVPATLTDGVTSIYVPRGGGSIPLGPDPHDWWLWAGPAYSAAKVAFPGGNATLGFTLDHEVSEDAYVLAAPGIEVAPDASTAETPEDAATELSGEGVGFAVLLADDEVPTVSVDEHDDILTVAASRASSVVWSWPWSANGKRPGHGAVPWAGLSALDMLAVSEGGQSNARFTVVDPIWAVRAMEEADPLEWDPRPDALWIGDPTTIAVYMDLLEAWLDIAPVGPRTWVGVDADRNTVAIEAGIVASRTCAGNGPRVTITDAGPGFLHLARVRVDAPRWMAIRQVTVRTSRSERTFAVDGAGEWTVQVPESATWVIAIATGDHASPATPEMAWAVSAPLWLRGPG